MRGAERAVLSDLATACDYADVQGLTERVKREIKNRGKTTAHLKDKACVEQIKGLLLEAGWKLVSLKIDDVFTVVKKGDPVGRLSGIVESFASIYEQDSGEKAGQWAIFMFLVVYFRDPSGIHRSVDLDNLNDKIDSIYREGVGQ